MMTPKLKWATAAASLLFATLTTTGCHVQSSHPNQKNIFDGAAYDSMILAHGALASLRVSIATDFPQYAVEFNQAAAAYNTAATIYSAYRNSANDELSVSAALGSLTVGVTSLEAALVSDLHVDGKRAAEVRKTALKIRARANAHVTVADILTELEVAASLAALTPSTEEYAALAQVIINATGAALKAEQAAADQPIQMSTIAALVPIS